VNINLTDRKRARNDLIPQGGGLQWYEIMIMDEKGKQVQRGQVREIVEKGDRNNSGG
jgi:hypothetical protein